MKKNMVAFSSRAGGYKFGVVALFFTTAVFLVGFSAPYWASASKGIWTCHKGLWMWCIVIDSSYHLSSYLATGCDSYGMSVSVVVHIVRVMLTLCTCLLVVACIYALVVNCCRTVPGPRSRVIEVLGIVGGLLGFAGAMVYVGFKDEGSTTGNFVFSIVSVSIEWDINWAFYLAAIGSGLSVVAAIIVAVFNKPVEGLPSTGGMVMTTVTAQPGYAPQPYAAQPQPYAAQSGYAPAKAGYPAPY